MANEAKVQGTRRRLSGRRITLILALLALFALGAKAWHDTMADPVVRRTAVVLPQLPVGTAPLRIALLSDIHVAGPDMPPSRVSAIVGQVNALNPDAVLIAGDLVSDKAFATRHYSAREVVAPLARLRAPLGTFVVPGNHDHWFDLSGIARELRRHGIALLVNDARQVGPLVIGGLDDAYTGRANVPAMLRAMDKLEGGWVVFSHSPDPFPELPRNVSLVLAGHTHCGQLGYPWGGAPVSLSRYGSRYACGRVDENGKVLITGAGLGTSLIPMRLFTRPDIWLIEVRPPKRPPNRSPAARS